VALLVALRTQDGKQDPRVSLPSSHDIHAFDDAKLNKYKEKSRRATILHRYGKNLLSLPYQDANLTPNS